MAWWGYPAHHDASDGSAATQWNATGAHANGRTARPGADAPGRSSMLGRLAALLEIGLHLLRLYQVVVVLVDRLPIADVARGNRHFFRLRGGVLRVALAPGRLLGRGFRRCGLVLCQSAGTEAGTCE